MNSVREEISLPEKNFTFLFRDFRSTAKAGVYLDLNKKGNKLLLF